MQFPILKDSFIKVIFCGTDNSNLINFLQWCSLNKPMLMPCVKGTRKTPRTGRSRCAVSVFQCIRGCWGGCLVFIHYFTISFCCGSVCVCFVCWHAGWHGANRDDNCWGCVSCPTVNPCVCVHTRTQRRPQCCVWNMADRCAVALSPVDSLIWEPALPAG